MNEKTFHREFRRAEIRRRVGQEPDYWLGYQRGLMRGFYGEYFHTDHEHELWLTLAGESDASLRERGRGYRDGLVMATAEEAA